MVDPIEEFLRRAAQHRREQVQQRRGQVQQRREQVQDDEIIDAEVLEDVETIEPKPGILSGEGIAEHVQQHIGSAGFGDRVAKLGSGVDASDDRMEAHLHEVFEHKLGQLGATTSRAAESTLDDDSGQTADKQQPLPDIRQLLNTPANIRNAILLNEILQRPEHRW